MNTTVVIQARSTSVRFPNKSMALLAGKPVIQHVVERCVRAGFRPIVAVPDDPVNERELIRFASTLDCFVIVGSREDVLGRFATVGTGPNVPHAIGRVTGDCPLIDPDHIQRVHTMFVWSGLDYLGQRNNPDGNDCEFFTLNALNRANKEATDEYDREHVTPWIRRKMNALDMKWPYGDFEGVKYSIDTPDDLALCERMLEMAGEKATWLQYVDAYMRIANDA